MPKIRRGNFMFVTWARDHSPRHVHVYRVQRLVVKWDLENWQPMRGKATTRVLKHLEELVKEGLI